MMAAMAVMAVRVPRARAVAEAYRALLAASERRRLSSSVNADEVARFAAASGKWWDEFGEYAMLHEMNPTRVRFMVDQLSHTAGPPQDTRAPLRGTRWLDVGSGGGLLAEVRPS